MNCTLTDCVNLGCVSTTLHTDPDIHFGELVKPNNEERLINLEPENLWLNQGQGRPIDFEKTTACLDYWMEN